MPVIAKTVYPTAPFFRKEDATVKTALGSIT